MASKLSLMELNLLVLIIKMMVMIEVFTLKTILKTSILFGVMHVLQDLDTIDGKFQYQINQNREKIDFVKSSFEDIPELCWYSLERICKFLKINRIS